MDLDTAWQLGTALGFGVLIGLERERTRGEQRAFAGVRTFSLATFQSEPHRRGAVPDLT